MKKGSLTEHPIDTNLTDALLPEITGGKGKNDVHTLKNQVAAKICCAVEGEHIFSFLEV